MKIIATSPDHYFDQLGPERKAQLMELRERIRSTWPRMKEDLAMAMPTYHLDGRTLFALGNQKNYFCLYVIPNELLDAFRNELRAYNLGRSCIRFRRLDDEALDLCGRIVRYVGGMQDEARSVRAERV